MDLGTYRYGLLTSWGGCSSELARKTYISRNCHIDQSKYCQTVPQVPGYSLSLLKLKNAFCAGRYCTAYVISVHGSECPPNSHKKKMVLKPDIAKRLYWRFGQHQKCASHNRSNDNANEVTSSEKCNTNSVFEFEFIPGCRDPLFLQTLCKMMCRKFSSRTRTDSRTVTPLLYCLWVLTSSITVELFADCLNESGVLSAYCSLDSEDNSFGRIGAWQDVEETVEGAGGNPPFETTFLQRMITKFDSGVRGTAPYCRCVLLPLCDRHGVLRRATALSSHGILLVRIPPGCLSFRWQEEYFISSSVKRYNCFQELGLFVWRNRPYLEKCPPPMDVDLLYLNFVVLACRNASKVNVDIQAIEMAFPTSFRDNHCRLPLLMEISNCSQGNDESLRSER